MSCVIHYLSNNLYYMKSQYLGISNPRKPIIKVLFFQTWQPFRPEPQWCSPATWPAFSPRRRLVQNPPALGMKGDEFSWHLYQTCNVGDRYFLGGLLIVMIFFLLFGNHLFKKKAAVRPWPLSAQKVIIWCFCAARTGDNKQPNKGVVV